MGDGGVYIYLFLFFLFEKYRRPSFYNSLRSALISSSAFCERGLMENLKGLG